MPEDFDGKSAAEREFLDRLYQREAQLRRDSADVGDATSAAYYDGMADAYLEIARLINGR